MNGLAMIARGDQGGLGALTYEMWRHLQPARTLVVTLGTPRGQEITDLYARPPAGCLVKRVPVAMLPRHLPWLFNGAAAVYTAETWYHPSVPDIARKRRVQTILHAMPELWTGAEWADHLWVPTTWRTDLVPAAEIVPVPIATDRLPYRQRTQGHVFFHPSAPAMLDRNGTDDFVAALRANNGRFFHTGARSRAVIRAEHDHDWGDDRIEWLPPVERYEDVIPERTDVMVMPRRYGGLCLPFGEACARGIPTVITALDPQIGWFPPGPLADELFVPATMVDKVRMKGGMVDVHAADIDRLADRLYRLVNEPALVRALSDEVYAWARQMAWDGPAGTEVRTRIADLCDGRV